MRAQNRLLLLVLVTLTQTLRSFARRRARRGGVELNLRDANLAS